MGSEVKRLTKESNWNWSTHVNGTVLCCLVSVVLVNCCEKKLENDATCEYNADVVVPVLSYPTLVEDNLMNEFDRHNAEVLNDVAESIKEGLNRTAENRLREMLDIFPDSPFANWQYGYLLYERAKQERNGKDLKQKAIGFIKKVVSIPNLTKTLLLRAVKFLTNIDQATQKDRIWSRVMNHYPDDVTIKLEYLYVIVDWDKNKKETASLLKKLHAEYPDDPIVNVYLGRFVGQHLKEYAIAITLIEPFITMDDKHIQNHNVYKTLGNAYVRTGDIEKATEIYQKGARLGLFLSEIQRCKYKHLQPLTARPIWTIEETPYQQYIEIIKHNIDDIRLEGTQHLKENNGYEVDSSGRIDTGRWKHLKLYGETNKERKNCLRAPRTCAIFADMPEVTNCYGCQIMFTAMYPGTHIWPHCGRDNTRLRVYFVIQAPGDACNIRVVDENRTLKEGDIFMFDVSMEHEIWYGGPEVGLVLVVDFLHPELTKLRDNGSQEKLELVNGQNVNFP